MVPRRTPWFVLATGIVFLILLETTAADGPDKAPPMKPATVKVEKSTLTAAVTMKGIVEAGQAHESSVRLKAWTGPLVVKSVVEHGTKVKKGDLIAEFDGEKLDILLRDARHERSIAELTIRQSELEMPILEKQLPLDLAAAEREYRIAQEDLKKFLELDKQQSIKNAEFMLKSSAFQVEYAKEELKQLQKMYKDKDLTEETEEMILKRQKHTLEMSEYSYQRSKLSREQAINIDLPRKEQTMKDSAAKAELSYTKAKDSLPLAFSIKQLGFVRAKYEETKAKQRLADLEADRAALAVKAPADGIVYYGRAIRGQWSGGTTLAPGGNVQSGEVFLTVVSTDQLLVRADVEEKDLPGLTPELAGKVTATAFPDSPLKAKVSRVAIAPFSGKFEVRLALESVPADLSLVPGMTCSVRVVTATQKDAISLPSSAVFKDDDETMAHYVYVTGKTDKPVKRPVKTGKTFGDRVQILEGVKLGDVVLASKP